MHAQFNKESNHVPNPSEPTLTDYYRIEKAIAYIKKHANHQPTLDDVAASVHLSDYHFQRMFSRWTGISPKRFLQYITKESAKKLLQGDPVRDGYGL